MKIRILLIFLMLSPLFIKAQSTDSANIKKDTVYEVFAVSKRAQFKKGGDNGLMTYIAENLVYPLEAMEEGVEGMVLVSFVVDEKGKVTNIETLNKEIGYGLEEAAMKVIKSTSGKWKPASIGDKKVKMKFRQPIRFTLQ